MKEAIIWSAIGAIGIPAVGFIWNLWRTNVKVRRFGVRIGKAASKICRRKIGISWEPLEQRFQETLHAFVDGVDEGLDWDDSTTKGEDV